LDFYAHFPLLQQQVNWSLTFDKIALSELIMMYIDKFFQFNVPAGKAVAWMMNSTALIQWQVVGDAETPSQVSLFYQYTSFPNPKWQPLALNLNNQGSFSWKIPEPNGTFYDGKYRLLVCFDAQCSAAKGTKYPEAGVSVEFAIYRNQGNRTLFDGIENGALSSIADLSFASLFVLPLSYILC
jgi:hypothetical protein